MFISQATLQRPQLDCTYITTHTHTRAIAHSTGLFNMAASLMTPSRFGNSHSGGQPAYATGPSMADTLPAIDFNFNDLRERMAQFTVRFDEFIERGRKRVLEERNAFRMNVADIGGMRISARAASYTTNSPQTSRDSASKPLPNSSRSRQIMQTFSLERHKKRRRCTKRFAH